ncbi:MAG: phosphatidylserine decarboxylase family protein [Bacteroidales bacterium]|nr:phosphatidylserine decarboxylase family protein [Bacteroidales bacterium]
MTLHREGKPTMAIAATVLAVVAVTLYIVNLPFWAKGFIFLPFLVLFLLVLWFFRVPARNLPPDGDIVIAPADGKIVVIEKTFEPEYFNDERIQVSVFMSPLNVHQNVYPVSGDVVYTKYHKGKYLVAWHPKSSTENERSTTVVKTGNGTEVLFRQIAGAVARRICFYSKPGDKATKGEEYGFIKFGSRVDIFLPVTAQILCKIGDKAVNKVTEIARI